MTYDKWKHYGTYLVAFTCIGPHVIWDEDQYEMDDSLDYEWLDIFYWDEGDDTIFSISAGVYLLLPCGSLEPFSFPETDD